MINFYFIRHGQTFANQKGIKQGAINSPMTYLSPEGKKQIYILSKNLNISFANKIFASPLHRTKETVSILNKNINLPVYYDKRLIEISYGNWDGKKNKKLEKKHFNLFDHYLHDVVPKYFSIAQGETFQNVYYRVQRFMIDVTRNEKNDNEKIIVITHGFVIKAAFFVALRTSKNMNSIPEPENASVTKIIKSKGHDKYYLGYFNRPGSQSF